MNLKKILEENNAEILSKMEKEGVKTVNCSVCNKYNITEREGEKR